METPSFSKGDDAAAKPWSIHLNSKTTGTKITKVLLQKSWVVPTRYKENSCWPLLSMESRPQSTKWWAAWRDCRRKIRRYVSPYGSYLSDLSHPVRLPWTPEIVYNQMYSNVSYWPWTSMPSVKRFSQSLCFSPVQTALAVAEVMLARSDTEAINLPKISKGETGSTGTALLKFHRSEEYLTLALHLEFHTPIISRAAKITCDLLPLQQFLWYRHGSALVPHGTTTAPGDQQILLRPVTGRQHHARHQVWKASLCLKKMQIRTAGNKQKPSSDSSGTSTMNALLKKMSPAVSMSMSQPKTKQSWTILSHLEPHDSRKVELMWEVEVRSVMACLKHLGQDGLKTNHVTLHCHWKMHTFHLGCMSVFVNPHLEGAPNARHRNWMQGHETSRNCNQFLQV